jgi:uncharacterized membrane protein YeiB
LQISLLAIEKLKESTLTIHHDNLTTNSKTSSKNTRKHLIIKFAMGALLMATMLGAMLGMNTKTTHAATNSSYITSVIRSTFGPYADQAIRIATCESTLNPSAVNSQAIGNSHAEGLFQILYPSTWRGTSQASASPFDARANARAAYEIFRRDGFSWREWQCHI